MFLYNGDSVKIDYREANSIAIFCWKQIINGVNLGVLQGFRLEVVGVLQWHQCKISPLLPNVSASALPLSMKPTFAPSTALAVKAFHGGIPKTDTMNTLGGVSLQNALKLYLMCSARTEQSLTQAVLCVGVGHYWSPGNNANPRSHVSLMEN